MTQPDPFPILNSAGLKEAAADCPLLRGESAEEWVECCSNRFLGVARAIVGDDALAEDILQESWIRVLQAVKNHAVGVPACPLVHTIVANKAKDFRRKRVRLKETSLPDDADPTRSLRTPQEEDRMLRLLREMIAVLPETYRQVVELRTCEGLSVEETAEIMDISKSTVSTRLHRAADMLKKRIDARLNRGDPDPSDPPEA